MLQHVFREFRVADMISDHFEEGSIGVAACNALLLGCPVIANVKPQVLRNARNDEILVLQADSDVHMALHIEQLVDDAQLLEATRYGGAAICREVLQFTGSSSRHLASI